MPQFCLHPPWSFLSLLISPSARRAARAGSIAEPGRVRSGSSNLNAKLSTATRLDRVVVFRTNCTPSCSQLSNPFTHCTNQRSSHGVLVIFVCPTQPWRSKLAGPTLVGLFLRPNSSDWPRTFSNLSLLSLISRINPGYSNPCIAPGYWAVSCATHCGRAMQCGTCPRSLKNCNPNAGATVKQF